MTAEIKGVLSLVRGSQTCFPRLDPAVKGCSCLIDEASVRLSDVPQGFNGAQRVVDVLSADHPVSDHSYARA